MKYHKEKIFELSDKCILVLSEETTEILGEPVYLLLNTATLDSFIIRKSTLDNIKLLDLDTPRSLRKSKKDSEMVMVEFNDTLKEWGVSKKKPKKRK